MARREFMYLATVLVALLLVLTFSTTEAAVKKKKSPPPLSSTSPTALAGCTRKKCPPQASPPPLDASTTLPPPSSEDAGNAEFHPPSPPPPSPPPPSPPPPNPPPPSPPSPPPPAPPPPSPPPPSPPPPDPPPPSPPPPFPPPPSPEPPSGSLVVIQPPRPPSPPPTGVSGLQSPPPPPPPNPPRPSIGAQSIFNYTMGSSTYTVFNARRTFVQAEMICNTYGGNLMSVLSANEQAVLASNLLSNNAYGIFGNALNISLWMGLRMNFATGRVWTDGNGLSYIPSFTDFNVYAEGLCYSLLCNPSRGCTWWGEVPALEGCTIVTRDGFICKTDSNRVKALRARYRGGVLPDSVYVLVRPPLPVAWTQADTACTSINGRLVSINDADEYLLLYSTLVNVTMSNAFLSSDFLPSGYLRVWTGLMYMSSLETSFWTDGTRADQGYIPQGTTTSAPFSCFSFWCRGNFCSWQSQWCGEELRAYWCEIRNIVV